MWGTRLRSLLSRKPPPLIYSLAGSPELRRQVRVHWLDSVRGDFKWRPAGTDNPTVADLKHTSLGFVIEETPESLTLASHQKDVGDGVMGVLMIPKVCIIGVDELK
jgi:hypothetical protein